MNVQKKSNFFGKLRTGWFYRPLAIALALLLFPGTPFFPNLTLVTPAHAYAPSSPCGSNVLVQDCTAPAALDSLVVQSFLALHNLPAGDASLIAQYGRGDLYSELRALLVANVIHVIKKAASDRTADEQSIYNWLQFNVQQHQIQQYQAAINDRNNWKSNACKWKPDATVAALYSLNYDPSSYCGQNLNVSALFTINPPVPTKDYFLTAALSGTYGSKILSTAGGQLALGQAQQDLALPLGLGIGGGVGFGVVVGGGLAAWLAAGGAAASGVSESLAGFIGVFGATGPVAIIVMAALCAAAATFEVVERQQVLDQLATLDGDLAWNQSHLPSLEGYANDPMGNYKITLTLIEATFPTTDSVTPPPAHRSSDAPFVVVSGLSANLSDSFNYTDWYGTKWTASTYGGWFTQQGVSKTGATVYSLSPVIRYVDWRGNYLSAGRLGQHFIVTKRVPAAGDAVCPADVSGVTPQTDYTKCASYVYDTIYLKDTSNNPAGVNLSLVPSITSGNSYGFGVSSGISNISINASGSPAPTIQTTTPLPSGFSFVSGGANGKATLTVNPATSGVGVFTVGLKASNTTPFTATQVVTVTVSDPVVILGSIPSSYSLYAGVPFSLTVAAAGAAPIAWSLSGTALPTGIAFHDNGDGTATISGTPTPQSVYTLCSNCTTLTATNSYGPASVYTGFNVSPFSGGVISSPTTITFNAGQANTSYVTTADTVNAVSFSMPCNDAPAWLTLKDNGNGTAVLSGTPPVNYIGGPINFTLRGSGLADAPLCNNHPNMTIQVKAMPYFQTPLYDVAPVNGNFSNPARPAVHGAGTTASGALPPSVSLHDAGDGAWFFIGNPPTGSGGEYRPVLTMITPNRSLDQTIHLFVTEAPTFSSAAQIYFYAGQSNKFVVDSSGYPKLPVSGYPGLPSGGMRYTVTGPLPQGVTFTDVDANSNPMGSGLLSGNPGTDFVGGTYLLNFTADNGVGQAQQPFVLKVYAAGDANHDGVVNCSDVQVVQAAMGAYRGTAKYNAAADLNNDGVINVVDLSIVSARLAPGTRCR